MRVPAISELNPQDPSYVTKLEQDVETLKILIFQALRKLEEVNSGLYFRILTSEAAYQRVVEELRFSSDVTTSTLEQSLANPPDQKETYSVESTVTRLSQLKTSYQDFCLAIYNLTEIIPVTEPNPNSPVFQFLVLHGDSVYVFDVNLSNLGASSFRPHPHLKRQHLEAESSLQILRQKAQESGFRGNLYIVKNPSSKIKPGMLAEYAQFQAIGGVLSKTHGENMVRFAFGLSGKLFLEDRLYL